MRQLCLMTLLFTTHFSFSLEAQTNILVEPNQWQTHKCTATFEQGTIHINSNGETSVMWIKDFSFATGIVEMDIKGDEDYLGLAFHGTDNQTYDAIYFRPFNFKRPERQGNAIQYIDKPHNEWDVLRKQFPGKYENTISPTPDAGTWFHAKFVIGTSEVKVYINGSETETFSIQKINHRKEGMLGLWVDVNDGYFKNLVIYEDE